MQKIFWIYIIIITIGFVFLTLPETGNKLVTINEYHGPSAPDSIGLALIILSWVCMLVTTVIRRKKITVLLKSKIIIGCVAAIGAGTVWLSVALLANSNYYWIPGMLLAVGGYGIFFWQLLRNSCSWTACIKSSWK